MLTDLNLPEHRGTIIGFSKIFRAVGNATSVSLAAFAFQWLVPTVGEPANFTIGLTFFQIFVIPILLCYLGIARSIRQDRPAVHKILVARGKNIQR